MRHKTWRAFWQHAFAVQDPDYKLTRADQELIKRIARFVVARGLTAPAVAALEASRPYSFLGSQFLAFMRPFAHIALPGADYDRLAKLLERRKSIDLLLEGIEEIDT